MRIAESRNGSHWQEAKQFRPGENLDAGDLFWFVLGHILLVPLALAALVGTALCLPLYWLWQRKRAGARKHTHGEVLRLQKEFRVNPAFERGARSEAAPHLSVIIPFYNRASWVPLVLNGVLSQYLPEGTIAEIIAVDNASTDNTADLLSQYPVRYVHCQQRGPAAARNAGLQAARAPIVAFTDSDCLADTHWLANLTAPFTDPDMLITGGRIISFDQDEFVATFTDSEKILSNERFFGGSAYFPRFFATANAAYRRDAIQRVGGFDNSLWMSEDADLAARVMDLGGRMAYMDDAAVYHQHRDTLRGLWRQAVDYGTASVAMFARHREKLDASHGIAWKNIRDLAWSPVALLLGPPANGVIGSSAPKENRGSRRRTEALYAFWRLGFTVGCVSESIRRRVFFI